MSYRSLFICCFILLSMPWMLKAAVVDQGAKDQIEKMETDLSREKEQVSKFHERERDLLRQLMQLEEEIADKKKSHADLRESLLQNKQEIERLRKNLSATETTLAEIEGRLARRLLAFYKFSKRGTFQVLAASRDLEDLGKKAKYLSRIMKADQQLLRETAELQRRHREEILQMRDKLGSIERMEKEESKRLLEIKDDLDKKVLIVMKIHKEREFYETGVKELELAAKTLRDKLLTLEKTESTKAELPVGFPAARGKLPLPCMGRVQKSSGGGPENGMKGIFILAPAGGEARAIFPGRIEFSGSLKGYGEIVVINHGSRFFSVTAFLERRKGEEGSMVKAGEVIGVVGQDGKPEGGKIYFEIRRGGTNLDPAEWLKLH